MFGVKFTEILYSWWVRLLIASIETVGNQHTKECSNYLAAQKRVDQFQKSDQ